MLTWLFGKLWNPPAKLTLGWHPLEWVHDDMVRWLKDTHRPRVYR